MATSNSMECHIERDPNSGCWLWSGAVRGGYGRVAHDGKNCAAHRVSYELHRGAIPPRLHIDHLCNTRLCVRPDHLEAVTQAENNFRANRRAKLKRTHCARGHEYSEANLLFYRGFRLCRACKHIRSAAARARNRSRGAS